MKPTNEAATSPNDRASAPTSSATSRNETSFGIFAKRNYRLYFAGQLVSLAGTWTQSVAQSWLVYRLTGSAFWLGIATLCGQLPVFLFATAGGEIADRHRRRNVLLVTQSAAMLLAFVLAWLTLRGTVTALHVLSLATLLGLVNAVDGPTRQSFVVDMVGREDVASAVALNASLATGAAVAGPAIAGVAIHALGEGACFAANGASFLVVIGCLFAMRELPDAAPRTREPLRVRLLEGFRFVASHARIRALLSLLAVTALFGIPCATLMPVFASQVLHGDASMLGWLMGAMGLGAMLAGLVLASHRDRRHRETWVAAACGALGLTQLAFALSSSSWLALALLLVLGAATLIQVSATNALVQELSPDALRGRVMAIWSMILMGFSPLGSVIAGAVTSAEGPRWPLAAGGVGCALGAVAFRRWSTSKNARVS